MLSHLVLLLPIPLPLIEFLEFFFSVFLTTLFLSSSQYSKLSKKGICGQGRGSFVWEKRRDKKSNRDSEKQDFPDLSFQILFSFFRNESVWII